MKWCTSVRHYELSQEHRSSTRGCFRTAGRPTESHVQLGVVMVRCKQICASGLKQLCRRAMEILARWLAESVNQPVWITRVDIRRNLELFMAIEFTRR